MNQPPRDYFVRWEGGQVVVYTVVLSQTIKVCNCDLHPDLVLEQGKKPWHIRLRQPHNCTWDSLSSLALKRGVAEGTMLSACWREEFAAFIIEGMVGDELHLTDTFINSWLVDCMLDELKAHTNILRRAKNASVWSN